MRTRTTGPPTSSPTGRRTGERDRDGERHLLGRTSATRLAWPSPSTATRSSSGRTGRHWREREQGSAYVFVRAGGGWANGNEIAKLTASDGRRTISSASPSTWAGTRWSRGENRRGTRRRAPPTSSSSRAEAGRTERESAKLTPSDGRRQQLRPVGRRAPGEQIITGANKDDIGANDGRARPTSSSSRAAGWASEAETCGS